MSGVIVTVTAIVVGVLLLALVVVFGIQQFRARPRPGDREDADGVVDYAAATPPREGITSSGDMLPGPGPAGFGSGGRMKG